MSLAISNINLFTLNLEAMHQFYTDTLGLTESDRSAPPTFYLFETGATTLTLQHVHASRSSIHPGSNIELGFEVAGDLTAIYDKLRANGSVVSAMEQMGWGSGFDATDPDGNRLTIFKKRT